MKIIPLLFGYLDFILLLVIFLYLSPEPASTGEFKAFQVGLMASTYLFPLAKSVEFLCGLSFVTGKFTTLSNLVIFL
jgi:uncharacterized membrane protein YphA (DoxX/SURF4 family)